jgi:hypothetical protein
MWSRGKFLSAFKPAFIQELLTNPIAQAVGDDSIRKRDSHDLASS